MLQALMEEKSVSVGGMRGLAGAHMDRHIKKATLHYINVIT